MNTIGSLKQKQMLFRPVVDGKLTSSRFVPEDLGLNPVISNFITKGQLLTVNCKVDATYAKYAIKLAIKSDSDKAKENDTQ